MKHIKLLTADFKALDWGLDSGANAIVAFIQAIVALITAIANLKNPQTGTQGQ
ncbi:MAG: hypothetical protein N3G21_08465 [Candidatus Hydrogenedentes bacterium]|nr:hypothetical protein [Candidatus Hydrogenedentota bacterium]